MELLFKEALGLKKEILGHNITADKDWNKGKEYKEVVQNKLPNYLRENFNLNNKIVKGKVGTGNYSAVPWVAIFNPAISESTQEGYYIAFLLHPEGKGVYLDLALGWTEVEKAYKGTFVNKKQYALSLSKKIGEYVDDNEYNFGKFLYSKNGDSKYDTQTNLLPFGYAHTSIVHKYYAFDDLNVQELHKDLNNFIQLYDNLTKKVTREFYNSILQDMNNINEQNQLDKVKEKNIGVSLSIVNPPQRSNYSKKTKVSTKRVTDDDIEKANYEKKLTGNTGEELAEKYFRNLIKENITSNELKGKFYELIDTSMGQKHGYGYDMEAFDPTNFSDPIKKLVEIKTTKSTRKDEPYYFSLNELNAMYENPGRYLIIRIYNVDSSEPKAFIVDPYKNYDSFANVEDMVEKVFEVQPVQYKIFNTKDDK